MKLMNRFNGKIIFEYECNSFKELIQEAVNKKINLSGANLFDTDLRDIDLSDSNLRDADLFRSNLSGSNLSGSNMSGSDLSSNTNLSDTNLSDTNLRGCDLSNTNLRGCDLSNTDLIGCDLRGTIGNMKEIRSMQIDVYTITFTKTFLQIGCQGHDTKKWKNFTNEEISKMDAGALQWWSKWKDIIFTIIELSFKENK